MDKVTGSKQRGRDCHGHGTHVAALAVGRTFGAAKGARVFSTRVLGCDSFGQYSTIVLGINHVIRTKRRNRSRRIIINMSITGPPSEAITNAIRTAKNEGILVVVAAGNYFKDACRYYLFFFMVCYHLFTQVCLSFSALHITQAHPPENITRSAFWTA